MLALINPERLIPGRFRGPAETQGTLLAQTFEWLSITVVRYRVIVVCLLLLSLAVLPLGLRRLVVQDSWIDGFDPDSEFRQATRLINDQFFGMHLLFVSVELPETLEVELPRSALTQEGIVLPRKLIEHPALIAGAPTRIWAASGKAISNTNQLPA